MENNEKSHKLPDSNELKSEKDCYRNGQYFHSCFVYIFGVYFHLHSRRVGYVGNRRVYGVVGNGWEKCWHQVGKNFPPDVNAFFTRFQ